MKMTYSLAAVAGLILGSALLSSVGLGYLLGVFLPYVAFLIFVIGFVYKVYAWATVPVPFRIPSTCGQQKSLPWIEHDKLDCPFTPAQTVGRMALEVLAFRSLFRNTKMKIIGDKVTHVSDKWLWLAAMAFHWSFFIIVVRHMRFFVEPVPFFVNGLDAVDGMLQIGAPGLYVTDLLILAGLGYLLARRVLFPMYRYLSLENDYFPLLLILSIAVTGVLMRYVVHADVTAVKTLAMGLVKFKPVVPETIGSLFYIHLVLVCVLMAYFPFSKLMHMGGVFMSPTRNLPNNSRAVRHINPWNPELKYVTYEKWEDDFREKMREAGMPLDKE